MGSRSDIGSILMADIGSAGTKLGLIDLVDGRYRFVASGRAPTTSQASLGDVSLGIREACRQIEAVTGRQILDDGGVMCPESPDGTGIDLFGVTASCQSALRVLAFGMMDVASLQTALARVNDATAQIIGTVSLQKASPKDEGLLGRILDDLGRYQPDVLLLVDGADNENRTLISELAHVLSALPAPSDGRRMPVVYSGGSASAAVLSELLRGKYDFHPTESIRGDDTAEEQRALERKLASLWVDRVATSVPGFSLVQSWVQMPTLSAAQAQMYVTRFLARNYECTVWCVDVGAATTSVLVATRDSFAPVVREGLGVGQGAVSLLPMAESIERWLPVHVTAPAIRDLMMNKRVRPWVLPQSSADLYFETALARAAVQSALGNQSEETGTIRPVLLGGLVVGSGATLAQSPTDGMAALAVLDALEPAGIASLAVDRHSIFPQMGALGVSFPAVATQVLVADGLYRLGTYVAPEGVAGQGDRAVTVAVERSGGIAVEVDVPFGAVHVIPLSGREEAQLRVSPHKRLDVGGGPGQAVSLKIRGGSLGVVVDARGRPIQVPSQPRDRWAKFTQWRDAVGG